MVLPCPDRRPPAYLFTVDGNLRWEGWAMCVGAAGPILVFNALVRFGATGD